MRACYTLFLRYFVTSSLFVSEGRIQIEMVGGEKIELGPRVSRISFSFGSAELEKDDNLLGY